MKRFGIDPSTEGAFKEIILTKDQLQEQLEYLRTVLYDDGTVASIRLYAAIYFCCCTGARRSEILRVRRKDLLLDGGHPTVTLLKRKGRKSNNLIMQKMVLPDKLVPILRRSLRLSPDIECVFSADDKHTTKTGFDEKLERSKADYLGKQIKEALKHSKWRYAARWHLYRHSLASIMLDDGVSKTNVMEHIGWCSDSMAKKYQHQTFERKAAIINSIV